MKRVLKFRQPLFTETGKFTQFHYWGFDADGTFTAPCGNLNEFEKAAAHDQFTGVSDKAGVDIYENDFVDNGTGNYIGLIEFKHCSFVHRGDNPLGFFVEDGIIEDNRSGDPDANITLQTYSPLEWAVVIGNIYQNPELIPA